MEVLTLLPAADDLDEMNIEIMRNTLYKAYLDDFARYCQSLGGATSELMEDLLAFEVHLFVLRLRRGCMPPLSAPPSYTLHKDMEGLLLFCSLFPLLPSGFPSFF